MDNKNSNVNGGGKDAALFGNAAGANYVGGTGEAPNADLAKPVDNTDELQAIAEGADPEAVKRAAEEKEARRNRYNPQQFENMRSQSVVYSQREITEQQLAEVRARNEAAVREAKLREAQEKAKRTSVKIGLIIFAVIIVVAVGWLLIVILSHTDPVVPPTPEPEPVKPVELSKVDGYSCETTVCGKIVDLPDGRIILRDTAYYIYNTSTKERTSTTIDQQDYISVKPFIWNKQILLTLDSMASKTAVFSISDNRYLVGYEHDVYYTDINDDVYKEMKWVEGSYIVAKTSGKYYLVSLANGMVAATATNHVFMRDNFIIGFENENRRYVYNKNNEMITVVDPGKEIYVKGDIVVIVTTTTSNGYTFYTLESFYASTKLSASGDNFVQNIYQSASNGNYLAVIKRTMYRIPDFN